MESPSFFHCLATDWTSAGLEMMRVLFSVMIIVLLCVFPCRPLHFWFCWDSFAIYGIHSKLFILCVNEMTRIAEENREGADAGDLTGFLSAIKIVRDKQLETTGPGRPLQCDF